MQNKTLKFTSELADLVLSGEKTCTWRIFDDKDLKKGDIITMIRRPNLTIFAKAEVISVLAKKLGEITNEDKIGHEDVGTMRQMYKIYTGFYNQTVGPETSVKIVRFKLI